MAEAVFQDLVDKANLRDQFLVDSAGTSQFHIGEAAHWGTQNVLAKHGIQYVGRSRQIKAIELPETDYIIAMDRDNLYDLQRLSHDQEVQARMSLLLSYAPNEDVTDVPDPYYTGNFERVYQLVKKGCEGLLDHIRQEQGV
jgi:protein-tyrosine phosphatase